MEGDTVWPALPVESWRNSRDTLHLWTQIVGKVRLALASEVNHWWHVPLYVNAAGLTTSLMPYENIGVEIAFDFVEHSLTIRTTRGETGRLALEPRSVADFYAEFRSRMTALGLNVPINTRPVELVEAIPFDDDKEHDSYDAEAVHAFWMSLVSAHRVLNNFRGRYQGKVSPVHFFWGAFDLAVTRFSGRGAPRHPGGVPNCPDWVMAEAYSHEVSSAGYWPGGTGEGMFYSYAYPEPAGYQAQSVEPSAAYYDSDLREFVLPYTAVRTSDAPADDLQKFLDSTFAAAAQLSDWPNLTRTPTIDSDATSRRGVHA